MVILGVVGVFGASCLLLELKEKLHLSECLSSGQSSAGSSEHGLKWPVNRNINPVRKNPTQRRLSVAAPQIFTQWC